MEQKNNNQHLFGIKTVAELTGIGQHTLRKWETRYQAVDVSRTETGRRVYSMEDVNRLVSLKLLVDQGEPIGHVATLSNDDLASRVAIIHDKTEEYQALQTVDAQPKQRVSVAIFGAFLSANLNKSSSVPNSLKIVVNDTSLSMFKEQLALLKPDALIVELPLINDETVNLIEDLLHLSSASRIVIVYRFGNTHSIDRLRPLGALFVKSPGHIEELLELVAVSTRPILTRENISLESVPKDLKNQIIPQRKFSEMELVRLSLVDSEIECECPRQLVDLVSSLAAFEQYSADCESKGEKDAELHAYLHRVTANSRYEMEKALEHLAMAEGLLKP